MTGWKEKAGRMPEQQLRDTIQAAHDALNEIAQTQGLDPNGECALDLCSAALAKLGNGKRHSRSL